jgi:hypothetical protein
MFEVTKAEQIILDNANRLMHSWDPKNPLLARLRTNSQHIIEVHPEEGEPFQEDLITVQMFVEDFLAVVAKRKNAIQATETLDLQTLYERSQLYQGLRQLIAKINGNVSEKIERFNETVLNSLNDLDAIEQSIVKKMLVDLKQLLIKLIFLQLEIAASHKLALFDIRFVENRVFDPTGQRADVLFTSHLLLNKLVSLGEFEYNENNLEIVAQLQASFSANLQSHFSFSNITRFSFYENGELIPSNMIVYPRWDIDDETAITLTQFEACRGGANQRFSKNLSTHYESPQLAVVLTGQFAECSQLPLYFQAMVEIANNHHCHEIVLYIPYDFMLKAHAYGFYSSNEALKQLCLGEVVKQLVETEPVPLLTEEVNQFQGEHELLTPVYFPLSGIDHRPVYFSECGVTMSYRELCQTQTIVKCTKSNGILPDYFGLLARPFCSLYELTRNRVLNGNIPSMHSCHLEKDMTDANWLKKENDLTAIAEASAMQTPERNTTIRLLR